MSAPETVSLAVAQAPPAGPGGQGEDFGKSSPVGLVLLILFGIAVAFLIRSMTKHLKKVPESFESTEKSDSSAASFSAGSSSTGSANAASGGPRAARESPSAQSPSVQSDASENQENAGHSGNPENTVANDSTEDTAGDATGEPAGEDTATAERGSSETK